MVLDSNAKYDPTTKSVLDPFVAPVNNAKNRVTKGAHYNTADFADFQVVAAHRGTLPMGKTGAALGFRCVQNGINKIKSVYKTLVK